MEKSGQLQIRVIKGIPEPVLDEAVDRGLKSGMGSSHLAIGWLKLFADGALGSQTAAQAFLMTACAGFGETMGSNPI